MTTTGQEGAACLEGAVTVPEGTVAEGIGVQGAGDISWVERKCSSRETRAYWFDYCWHLGRVRDDGDSRRDYFVLKHFGTCRGKGAAGLLGCKLASEKQAGSKTGINWDDWAPGRDYNDGCLDIPLSVGVGPTTLGGTLHACERIDITKYRPAPKFSTAWRSLFPTYASERDVAYQLSMVVAQGRIPPLYYRWAVRWSII